MTENDIGAADGSTAGLSDFAAGGRVRIEAVPWDDVRALALRAAMDEELRPLYADRWGAEASATGPRPARMEVIPADLIVTLIAVAADSRPVGHAALRWLDGRAEVKRVFVDKGSRGAGVSVRLMLALESAARDHGAAELVLQTGDRQPEAVRLYEKLGYRRIPIFPPYTALPYSMCFAKAL
jgi:GNAT superfamily N-acetyltransferase